MGYLLNMVKQARKGATSNTAIPSQDLNMPATPIKPAAPDARPMLQAHQNVWNSMNAGQTVAPRRVENNQPIPKLQAKGATDPVLAQGQPTITQSMNTPVSAPTVTTAKATPGASAPSGNWLSNTLGKVNKFLTPTTVNTPVTQPSAAPVQQVAKTTPAATQPTTRRPPRSDTRAADLATKRVYAEQNARMADRRSKGLDPILGTLTMDSSKANMQARKNIPNTPIYDVPSSGVLNDLGMSNGTIGSGRGQHMTAYNKGFAPALADTTANTTKGSGFLSNRVTPNVNVTGTAGNMLMDGLKGGLDGAGPRLLTRGLKFRA